MPKAAERPEVEEGRAVRLCLDPEAHRLLRLVSADADSTMADTVKRVVTAYVREEAGRRNLLR